MLVTQIGFFETITGEAKQLGPIRFFAQQQLPRPLAHGEGRPIVSAASSRASFVASGGLRSNLTQFQRKWVPLGDPFFVW